MLTEDRNGEIYDKNVPNLVKLCRESVTRGDNELPGVLKMIFDA